VGKDTRTSSPLYSLLPSKIEGFNSLADLALFFASLLDPLI